MNTIMTGDALAAIIPWLESHTPATVTNTLPSGDVTQVTQPLLVVTARAGAMRALGLTSWVTLDYDYYVPADTGVTEHDGARDAATLHSFTTADSIPAPIVGVNWSGSTMPLCVGLDYGAWRYAWHIEYMVANTAKTI